MKKKKAILVTDAEVKISHAWRLSVRCTSFFCIRPAKKLANRGMSKIKSQILAMNSLGSMSREGKSMKKRVVSMFLAGMMVLGNTGTVLAAEESVVPVQSEAVESQVETPADETKEQVSETSETEEAAQEETEEAAPAESKTEEAAPAEEAAQSQTEEAVVSEDEESLIDTQAEEGEAEELTGEGYVMMNIPYDEFYKADLNNSEKVDAFTSATFNKTRTSSLAGGSYHVNADGSDITGVTFPVKVTDLSVLKDQKQIKDDSSVTIEVTNRGQTSETTYTGQDALFESDTYSFYVLKEKPEFYKEMTVDSDGKFSFGKVKGNEATVVKLGDDYTFTTDTTYGDYQLDLDEEEVEKYFDHATDKIYGTVINTTDGSNYGLRHVENIWLGSKLAWCTGFTSSVHNCPTSSDHYKSMMGKTIDSVTYYTSKGIYTFDIDDVKVPAKNGISAEVADMAEGAETTAVAFKNGNDTATLPTDFEAKYDVDGTEVTCADDKISGLAGLTVGTHTLTITDQSSTYADIKATFTVTSAVAPQAEVDAKLGKLVPTGDFTQDKLNNFLKNITSVNVDGTDYAASGRGSKKLINADGTFDSTNMASLNLDDTAQFEVTATGYTEKLKFTYTTYTYLYAALNWSEFWANEPVYNAGDTSSSDKLDAKRETDKGGFDVVTRATTNHGLHRGSFQSTAVIYAENGKTYKVSHWSEDGKTIYLTGGGSIGWNRGTITDNGTTTKMTKYEVLGIKYVPVKVATADLFAFTQQYDVTYNGETLQGGYTEINLNAYSEVANVTSATNGLKTATLSGDSFSFSAAASGNDSGLQGAALKTATGITPDLRTSDDIGSFGEFIRLDLNGNYGDLGAQMQSVEWTYYGNDSTYTEAVRTFGTKFAADNWMHKSMGIQLGLTESVRCQLPEGSDGTGYWKVTVHALGYADYSYKFQATSDNIVLSANIADTETRKALEDKLAEIKKLKESDYTAESWASLKTEVEEGEELLAKTNATKAAVTEQVKHLTEAVNALVKVADKTALTNKVAEAKKITKDAYTTATWNALQTAIKDAESVLNAANPDQATVDAKVKSLTAAINALVKKADQTALRAKVTEAKKIARGTYTTATWNALQTAIKDAENVLNTTDPAQATINEKLTVLTNAMGALKQNTLSVSVAASTIGVGETTTVNAAVSGDFQNVTWATSNAAVATVNGGKVTAKKAGTVTITATANGISQSVTVKVVNPSVVLATTKATLYTAGSKTLNLNAKVYGVNKNVTYKTSNKKVATVSKKGVVTAKKKGTAKITATIKVNGKNKSVTCKVTVKKPSIKLAKSSATLKVGATTTIKVTSTPAGKATFKTSNKKVATVNGNGVVTAKKKGTAKITVKCNGVSKTFKVKVKK